MSVRGNAAPRGMTAHDRIRLTGPFAEFKAVADSPGLGDPPPGLAIFPVLFGFREMATRPLEPGACSMAR